MSNEQHFGDFIIAIENAFHSAQKISQTQHLNMLADYFDKDNVPICVDIKFPKYNVETQTLDYTLVKVPKLCLVPVSSLKLSEAKLNFKINFTDIADKDNCDQIGLIGALCNSSNNEQLGATVELTFQSTNAPEGLLKLNDELTRILP
jgi:hypothetical protein